LDADLVIWSSALIEERERVERSNLHFRKKGAFYNSPKFLAVGHFRGIKISRKLPPNL
jgi:hypothetical protein